MRLLRHVIVSLVALWNIQVLGALSVSAQDQAVPRILEMPTLTESLKFSGQILVCGQEVPYTDPDVREGLEKEMLLALWNRPQVILWLKRANRYFPHIEKILRQEGLPDDLKYVPVIESALRPHSESGRGAVGYWQFLSATGKKFGLRVDNMVDERRDIFKSTRAACRYFKALKEEFGTYHLALAAYNMGEFGLAQELDAQNATGFFDLYLPLETQRYVFKMAAAKLIMENPVQYGFHLSPQDLYPVLAFSEIEFSMSETIPLVMIAQAARIPFKTLKEYNPELRGYELAPEKMTVRLPKGGEDGFKERFANIYKTSQIKSPPQYHIVRSGESLTGIAEQYQITLPALLRLNRFSYGKVIHPGERIRVR